MPEASCQTQKLLVWLVFKSITAIYSISVVELYKCFRQIYSYWKSHTNWNEECKTKEFATYAHGRKWLQWSNFI